MVADYSAELGEHEDVLLKIMDLAQEIGVEFAFPTRTLHVETMPTAAPGCRSRCLISTG
jgi:MscS family membrane protein